jgi:hypothetical protein
MLRDVKHPARRSSKGARTFVGTRVLPSVVADLDAARVRDLEFVPHPVRSHLTLRDGVTRNDWVAAAILLALAHDAHLAPFIEPGHRKADAELVAGRVPDPWVIWIDTRRACMPHQGRHAVSRSQWLSAVLRWALEQPPGLVAAELIHVPRRDVHAAGQTALEVLTPRAG